MKKIAKSLIIAFVILAAATLGAGIYFINYALSPKDRSRYNEDTEFSIMKNEYPHIAHWIDSIRPILHDEYITNNDGLNLHAYSAVADTSTTRTAVIVHGYKMCAISMLHIAYLYHHDLHYNVILPDLQGHGMSDGNTIQMGWKDKDDVKQWINYADSIFGGNTQIVVTGISMGGATTMMVSADPTPDCVKCFVEDCGYTSVWYEFKGELKAQFNLPAFPLLYTTSALNKLLNGWSLTEASALHQIQRCSKPMLFIHGDNDTYVPTPMVYELYNAKAEPKGIYISKGSAHAKSYADNPELYTKAVRDFVCRYIH